MKSKLLTALGATGVLRPYIANPEHILERKILLQPAFNPNPTGGGGGPPPPPTLTVDTYTPLNDPTFVLANGNCNDTAKPSRLFTAPNTAIVSDTGFAPNITPVAFYGSGGDNRGCYTTDATLNFAANQQFTMFCWIKFDSRLGFEALMGNNDNSNTSGWYLGLWVTNYCIRGFDNTGTDVHFDSGIAPVNGVWTFVAGGYDGTNLWVQVNAGARGTQALAGLKAATGNYAVGNYSNSGTTFRAPAGRLGGVGMALRTLSTTDISNIYNGGAGQPPSYFI